MRPHTARRSALRTYRPLIAGSLLSLSLTLRVPPPGYAQQAPPAGPDTVELFIPLHRPLAEAIARMGGILSALGGRVDEDRLSS